MPNFSYSQERNLDFGTRVLPSKLIENSEGIIQVYAKQGTTVVPEKINGLTVTSLDSSIIRVISVRSSESSFVTEVTVNALKPGATKLFLAAPGFTPTELPVLINGNKLNQEKLLVKAIPDTFSSNGPFRGFVSVELADEDGIPVVAREDTPISLTTSDSLVSIFQKDLVIKKGEYFTGTQFTIKDSGMATIFASGKGIDGKSNEITSGEESEHLTLGLYVFPDKINTASDRTVGHIIAVLHEGDGEKNSAIDEEDPVVVAKKDIPVKYKVTNSLFDTANISNDAEIGESGGIFMIKKGSYWGHTTFEVLGGDESFAGTYDITITSSDPISLRTKKVQAVYDDDKKQEGEKFIKLDAIPIYATGNQELIGVVHLEDKDNYPIVASKHLEVTIDSSDDDFIKINPVTIPIGQGSALVFGTVGSSITDENLNLNAAVETNENNPELVEVFVHGATQKELDLVVEPLISKIITNTDFPMVAYMQGKDGISNFPENSNLFISPSKYFDVDSKEISRGTDLLMLDAKSLQSGQDIIQFSIDNYETNVNLVSHSLKPAELQIEHSETIFSGNNDIFSVQLLNSKGSPVFATEDVIVQLVAKDESILQIPPQVVIPQGNYYSLFDVAPKKSGQTELSALAEGLPLISTNVKVVDLKPTIDFSSPEIIQEGESFVAGISVKQENLGLPGLQVKWNVEGGLAQISDSKTGPNGEAQISIIPTSNDKIRIDATVSGTFYSENKVTNTIRVNATSSEFLAQADDGQGSIEFTKPEIAGIDPVIIIVPAALGIVGYMLKKQGMFSLKQSSTVQKTS